MKIEYIIFIVKDSRGNADYAVTNEDANCIQICNMHDKKGKRIYFESNAYHLEKWCKDYDLGYLRLEREEDIDVTSIIV
jgi:hypothetical protein